MNMDEIRAQSQARLAKILELRDTGMTYLEIARSLRVSKGVVMGHMHRAGLTRKENNPIFNRPPPRPGRRKVSTAQASLTAQKATPGLSQARTEPPRLSRHTKCQFIAGEPSADDAACKCLKPAQLGSSFCPAHHRKCWKRTLAEAVA